MNQPLVSIIGTFYNSGSYVTSAMESLLNQTYKNIEFICINDGSNDDTLERLEKFAKNDPRIKLFSKKNENSPHNAIAFGQERVSGDYVMSFDHDDLLSCDAVEEAVKSMTNNPNWDISLFKVFVKDKNGEKELKKRPTKILSGKDAVISCLKGFEYSMRPFYKTKIYKTENYQFIQAWQNYDEYIGIKILGNSKNIGLNEGKYYYQDNPNSITSQVKFRHIETLEVHLILMKDYLIKKNIYDEIKDWYEFIIFKRLNSMIYYYNKKVLKQIILDDYQKTYARDLFERCFNKLNKKVLINNSKGLEKVYLKLILSNFFIYSLVRKFK